jgi:hypothetical protein
MTSFILLSDVGEADGPTKVVPLAVGESVPYWPNALVERANAYVTNYLPAGTFVGDGVLTLRNDYDLGVLNGIRATIEQVDLDREVLRLRSEGGGCVDLPFEYAEVGHLTHGYATTVHKAQGLTVDHCYVLANDTTTREHADTALSRGRHANHVYVVADDRRSEERHVTEIEPNALQEVRRAVSRSVAQHLAIDTGRPAHEQSALEVARRERDRLRAKLNGAPPDRTWEWQRVYNEYCSEERRRAEATRRRDGAEKDLRDLGPVGRRIHPSRRDAIQRRIEAADEAVATHATRLADIATQISGLTPDVQDRRTWEHRHAADLWRLGALDDQIKMTERLDRIATRSAERSIGHDLGLGL